jgi:signal transduction histidine kinase
MSDGGVLSVDIDQDQDTGAVTVLVGDSGAGMSAETKRRAFDPFFTTKGNQGTGLGLVIVRNTVVRRGGEIAVDSDVGKGTRFRIRLPALGHSGLTAKGTPKEKGGACAPPGGGPEVDQKSN